MIKSFFDSTCLPERVIESTNLQRQSPPHIVFLFNETIMKLNQQIYSISTLSSKIVVEQTEKIVQESFFYALLKGINSQQIPLKIDVLLLTILELNEYYNYQPDDGESIKLEIREEIITNSIISCFRFLLKEKSWSYIDAANFFEKMYHLHTLRYGNKDVTPILTLIDGGPAAGYLSPNSKKFMDEITYDEQFTPIVEYLLVHEDISEKKHQLYIAQIADKFFTKAVKASYLVMSRNIYKFPKAKHVSVLAEGIGEFRQITIRTKYIYLRALRELHLSCFSKNEMKVITKKTVISHQTYNVSFAIVSEENKATIKAITVSLDDLEGSSLDSPTITDQDIYFFVEDFKEETPMAHPNPSIPLSERPLYKFELIYNSHAIRLQKASEDMRKEIINLIRDIQGEMSEEEKNKVILECTVHTAIWHQKELMLVEIIRQIGSMLSSRALYGEIKTYMRDLSNKAIFSEDFIKRLEGVLIGAYVLVTNEYLSSWHQDDILKPSHTRSSPFIHETHIMKIIKNCTWEVFKKHKYPGKWLLKSIMTCGYDGNPAKLVPLNNVTPVNKIMTQIRFEECKILLNTALMLQTDQVVLALIKEMVKGILAIMKQSIPNKIIEDMTTYFASIAEFPLKIIPDILIKKKTSRWKASYLFYTLFNLKSLGIEATDEQRQKIKFFLLNRECKEF